MYGSSGTRTAFAARCLLRQAPWATLATQADGQPFASLVTHAITGRGSVLMLLSSLAEHARHLAREPRCALLVAGKPENLNPQTAARLTVTGIAVQRDDVVLRRLWLRRHPYAALYADFADFSIWEVTPLAGVFVGGFARADKLAGRDLTIAPAAADALAAAEAGILGRCNTEHAEAVDDLAHAQGATGHWQMIGVDADGLDIVQDETVRRIAFDAPVEDAAGVRETLLRMLAVARTRW